MSIGAFIAEKKNIEYCHLLSKIMISYIGNSIANLISGVSLRFPNSFLMILNGKIDKIYKITDLVGLVPQGDCQCSGDFP